MKKLFLLIPALILSMIVNATVKNITPTTPYDGHDNLRLALHYAHTEKFDTIILADGTYVEKDNYLYMDTNMVILAAEGAHPVIEMKTYAQIKNGANIKIKGLKFNGGAQGSYSYYFRFYDNSHSSLVIEDCDLYDIKNYVFYGAGDTHTDSLIINNCFLYNNKKNAVYFPKGTIEGIHPCDKLSITNSTIANSDALTDYTSTIDIHSYNDAMTDAVKVIIDRCTFYNNPTINSDHSAIRPYKLSDVTIKNCIFAHPEAYARRATSCYGGAISNCLTYNLTYDAGRNGHRQDGGKPTLSGNYTGNPLFVDAANNDLTLHNASAARREDGSVYGDPRWAKAIQTIAIPAKLNAVDAIVSDSVGVRLSANATDPDSIDFKLLGGSYKYISSEWAKWKFEVTKAGKYKFKANVTSTNAQKYTLSVLDNNENPVAGGTVDQSSNIGDGDKSFSTDILDLTAGTYYIKILNKTEWSEGRVLSIDATYEGGATIAVPDTLWPIEALKSERAFVNEAGELRFTDDDHAGEVREQYGKWKINVAKAGCYKFKVTANSTNSHAYELILRNSAETQDIASKVQKGSSGQQLQFALDVDDLAANNYVLFIRDTTKWSLGRIHDIAVTYEGGAAANIPGQILGVDAMLRKEDGGTLKMYHLENGDIQYNDNEDNMTEYALWNINATEAGKMTVTLNVAHSGHSFSIEVYQGNTRLDSIGETNATIWENGDIVLAEQITIPAAGAYTLKLINNQQYSGGALHGITFTPYVAPAAIVIDEAAEDNSAWVANVGGAAVNVQLKRTFKGGVYNSICVPFEAPMSKIKAAFGNDVELLYLSNVSLSGDILNLEFTAAPDFYQGTPYLIKPSADVINPEFENVNLLAAEAASTSHTGWVASYRGTFVKKTIPANEDNLYLGTDNNLYFSSNPVTIKGLRAYFEVSIQANAIKRARLVTPNNMPTDIEIVESQDTKAVKAIQNGQVIIIRDGKKFNVMGLQVK